jgi:hypothetical protein
MDGTRGVIETAVTTARFAKDQTKTERIAKFVLWPSGAYAVVCRAEQRGHGVLVKYDGRSELHIVQVGDRGLEETVVGGRTTSRGVAISISRLTVTRDGDLLYEWLVRRPGLDRRETWRVPARGPRTWEQVDRRPGHTTTYRNVGPRQFEGMTVDGRGALLWTSRWVRDAKGLAGIYADPQGKVVGNVLLGAREEDGSRVMTWDGPLSRGSLSLGGAA